MDRTKQNLKWVWFFLALGFACLLLSFFYSYFGQNSEVSPGKIGNIEAAKGEAFLVGPDYHNRQKAIAGQSVRSLDSLELKDGATIYLQLESGDRITLYDESLLTFEKDPINQKIFIYVKRGDFSTTQVGSRPDVFIVKNGERVPLADYETSILKTEVAKYQGAHSDPRDQTLSEDEIFAVLARNKAAFFKCYGNLLQKKPQMKGAVALNFAIENSGHISNVTVSTKELDREDFKQCLMSVISRINFRPFRGSPITSYFPLQFD